MGLYTISLSIVHEHWTLNNNSEEILSSHIKMTSAYCLHSINLCECWMLNAALFNVHFTVRQLTCISYLYFKAVAFDDKLNWYMAQFCMKEMKHF